MELLMHRRRHLPLHNTEPAFFGRGQDNEKKWNSISSKIKTRKKLEQLGWLDTPIEYRYNSNNFRSIEFEEPHDAIACFGCSHTEGEGVRQEFRWSDVLANMLGLKCYNFGEGGSGINSHYTNVSTWIPKLKPKAVFVFASYPFRYDFYYKGKRITLNKTIYGASDRVEKKHFEIMWQSFFSDDRNFSSNHKKSMEAIKYICLQLDIPCVVIPVEEYFLTDPIDRCARDLEHPGESQHGRIAEAMLKEFYNA